MVVQAGAGRRLVASDPARAAAAFADIADVAGEAHVEIRKLVELLRLDPPERLDPELAPALVDLTDRVRAAGLDIRYAYTGPPGLLPAPTSSAAYRIAQESVTNAIKHAPGAPIWLSVRRDAESISIEVVNGRPRAGVADLCAAGGGHGLRGMERRVAAVAGSFGAGPGPDGSWRVWARLPTGPAVHLDEL
jgi:signal transduction histidine kinase